MNKHFNSRQQRTTLILPLILLWLLPVEGYSSSQDEAAEKLWVEDQDTATAYMTAGLEKGVLKVNDAIYVAPGFGNTFLVVTSDGNIVVDTSHKDVAPNHKQKLSAISSTETRYIIVTHGHGDHTGGIGIWKQPDTEVIAHDNFVEFLHYQKRLEGFFARRNEAQFGTNITAITPDQAGHKVTGNYTAEIPATILFETKYQISQGGLTFEIFHTPGETDDAISVWIPEFKAAFIGDLFYDSFPNIYSLRGTRTRFALDYVESINVILGLEPEILLPSHGDPILGHSEITRRLTKYRDAILYVHDETVKGMNDGVDVQTLMRQITLPPELSGGDLAELYGKVSWSVRGIYEGYQGWFNGTLGDMYGTSDKDLIGQFIELAGGSQRVSAQALDLVAEGQSLVGLRMAESVLAYDPANSIALKVQLRALQYLRSRSTNDIEAAWLNNGIKDTERLLSDSDNKR